MGSGRMKERAPVKEALWTRTALSLAVLVMVGVLSGVEAQDKGELHTHTHTGTGLEGTSATVRGFSTSHWPQPFSTT